MTSLSDRLREPRYISDEDHARTPDAVLITLQEFRHERSVAADAIDQLVEGLKLAKARIRNLSLAVHGESFVTGQGERRVAEIDALIASVEGGE